MSLGARRFRTHNRRLCRCGRPALFRRPRSNTLAWCRQHPLCRQCLRGLIDGSRAERFDKAAFFFSPVADRKEVA